MESSRRDTWVVVVLLLQLLPCRNLRTRVAQGFNVRPTLAFCKASTTTADTMIQPCKIPKGSQKPDRKFCRRNVRSLSFLEDRKVFVSRTRIQSTISRASLMTIGVLLTTQQHHKPQPLKEGCTCCDRNLPCQYPELQASDTDVPSPPRLSATNRVSHVRATSKRTDSCPQQRSVRAALRRKRAADNRQTIKSSQ